MKTILFHVQDDGQTVHGLENALSLARATGAHLHCVHAVPTVAYVAGGLAGAAFVVDDIVVRERERTEKLEALINAELDNEDVSWDFEHVDADTVVELARRGALADLIVSSRQAAREQDYDVPVGRLGSLLSRSRTPIFIPGDDGAMVDPKGTALIAWDGSFESALAVRGALGLLKIADNVRVVRVDRGKPDFPDTQLLEYLSRYDIHAELTIEPYHETDVVPVLLGHAQREKAAYIVLGGYSHSRLGEWFFGGVTRSMLKHSPVGLIMAH